MRETLQLLFKRFGLLNRDCCADSPYDVTYAEFYLMQELHKLERVAMQRLAAHLQLDITTVSRQVQALVGKGWVIKVAALTDRRVQEVQLTEQGERVVIEMIAAMDQQINQVLAEMNEFERGIVQQSLQRFADAMCNVDTRCQPAWKSKS